MMLVSGPVFAALEITQAPARLYWDGATAPAQGNTIVLRYETVGLYRYDPTSPDSYQVWTSNLASPDSLTGTPAVGTSLPVPLDASGNPITLDTTVPLSPANSFAENEALFVVLEQPILPPAAYANRPDGRRIIAVTLDVSGPGGSFAHTIALVETALNNNQFSGYIQADTGIEIPAQSTVTIRYNAYGDVDDSATTAPPYSVDAATLASRTSPRSALVGGIPGGDSPLYVSKEALRSTAAIGDFVPFRIRVENTGAFTVTNAELVDVLPKGMRYQSGSLRIDGSADTDPLTSNGRTLRKGLGNIAAGESITVQYVVEIDVGASEGSLRNVAFARAENDSSNRAVASVLVENPLFSDKVFLMGRVIVGECGDSAAEGLGGVRLYLSDGTNVVTDDKGRWHIEGIRSGTHVLQLDEETLGARYALRQCHDNTRKAGNVASRFVEAQGGTLWRENFYLEAKAPVEANIQQQLVTEMSGHEAVIYLPISNGETEFESVSVRLFLPSSVSPVPGSAEVDGEAIGDGEQFGNYYLYTFRTRGQYWTSHFKVALQLDPTTLESGRASILAKTTGTTPEGDAHVVSSVNWVNIQGADTEQQRIILHPVFDKLSAKLTARDVIALEEAAQRLENHNDLRLIITGHSDSVPLRRSEKHPFSDNYDLSLARANAVADFMKERLNLPDSAVKTLGVGPDEPIATNKTAAGRAQNRRVELQLVVSGIVGSATWNLEIPDSGLNVDSNTRLERDLASRPEPERHGFTNLEDGQILGQTVTAVTAEFDKRLKATLIVDGEQVSNERIGLSLESEDSPTRKVTWVGVEFEQPGEHELELIGKDPFGNIRLQEKITILRAGGIKKIDLAPVQAENIADGRTPVVMKIRVIDEFDREIKAALDLELVSGNLEPLNNSQTDRPLTEERRQVRMDAQGNIRFEPVGTAGLYRVRLSAGNVISDPIDIIVKPELRDWILVGYAKGTVGHSTLDDNMENLPEAEEDMYTDGEASFFARGRIKGEWLLTMAYDSQREREDAPLKQAINPEKYYALYGDDTQRGHDAASREKLYLRIERQDFFALFGDFDTGLTVTELSDFQRTLTGFQTGYDGRHVSATAFAAETEQGFIRDDIRADGTSGLYQTSRQDIVPGSETIVIETRDRFTNEVISSQPQTRFADYSFDYQTGTFFFRLPVAQQDDSFNPVRIVVTYEVEGTLEDSVAGGRVTIHDEEKKIVVGLTAVDDNTLGAENSLAGADFAYKPNDNHEFRAEKAQTDSRDITSRSQDDAWLVEHQYTSEKLDTRVRIEKTDAGFGIGQIAEDDQDIEKTLVDGRYRLTEELSVSASASRQEVPSTSNQRDQFDTRLEHQTPEWKSYAGYRYAKDQVGSQDYASQQLVAGSSKELLDGKVTARIQGETGLSDSENSDFPDRLGVGADWRLTNKVTLFANQDFIWGDQYKAQESRAGVKATPWKGSTAVTDVLRSQDEFGSRLLAHAGLYQRIDLNSRWSTDFGIDRAQTIDGDNRNPTFDSRRPAASGTNSEDYTALSAGLGYRDGAWEWTNRVEYRHADLEDKYNLLSGFRHRIDSADSMAGKIEHFDRDLATGERYRESTVDFSYARRPIGGYWFWLNRTALTFDEMRDALAHLRGQRLVNNTHMNFLDEGRYQLSFQYGARYVLDTIDAQRYKGYTDLIGIQYRHDLTRYWDAGFQASTMTSHNANISKSSYGLSIGFSPVQDVWLSLGYNFDGFYDKDFDNASSRAKGIVLDFRIKFDQNSARRWRGERD